MKQYEIANYLGNVLTTLTDNKLAVNSSGMVSGYVAQISSSSDYYPFGSIQPDRNINAGDYRFGFNGQEMDNEVSGTGNTNTAMFWEYDTRLGRRWNMDPVVKQWESPYACFSGNPIWYKDPNGDNAWHPDNNGNLVADDGDNEFTLQNYIWSYTVSTITTSQSRELLRTMLNQNSNGIHGITGYKVYLNDVRKVAGDHIATMLNPGTKSVHAGQEAFLENPVVKATLFALSFAIPVSGLVKTVKAAQYATTAVKQWGLVSSFFGNLFGLAKATDDAMGGNLFHRNSIPAEIADKIGYPNLAIKIDRIIALKNVVKNVSGGDKFVATEGLQDAKDLLEDSSSNNTQNNENTGYEKK